MRKKTVKKVIDIRLQKPHASQRVVLDNAKRFNAVRNGRRWGKTAMGAYLTCKTVIEGGPVGAFFPTREFGDDFWEEVKTRLEPITIYKSESNRLIKTITGGSVKCWSMEKPRAGRGRKYKRVILDEFAFAKNPKESWTKAIRPTLTDLKGDAWFLSTPNGKNNYFYDICQMELRNKSYKTFHMPSSTNPFIEQEELDAIREELDELTWEQEFLAEFIDFNGRPFAYSFRAEKHVATEDNPIGEIDPGLPLDLSFDFNVDPITCIASQHSEDKRKIRVFKEFRLKSSDIYELCDAIIAEYGDNYYFRVTGDASGNNRSAMVSDNLNYYKIIKKRLQLDKGQIKVPGANPLHRNSRTLLNSILKRHPDFLIDPSCQHLIADCKFVQCKSNGEIDKGEDAHQGHLFDCLRYYLNTWHSGWLAKYNEESD